MRGLALHAAWLTAGGGRLAIWAEVETKPVRRRAVTTDAAEPATGYRSHPFCAKREELLDALTRLWKTSRPALTPRTSAPVKRIEIRLPRLGSRPVPSPEYVARQWAPEPEGAEDAVLSVWRVNALILDAESACVLLAGLSHKPGSSAAPARLRPNPYANARVLDERPMLFGADLRFWAAAARLAMRLILRQRYVPAVYESQVSALYPYSGLSVAPLFAEWRLAPLEPDDQRRFETLAASMPDAARAAVEYRSAQPAVLSVNGMDIQDGLDILDILDMPDTPVAPDHAAPPEPSALLSHFLASAVNALLETWARNAQIFLHMPAGEPEGSRGLRYYSPRFTITSRWLGALNMHGRPIYLQATEARALLDGVEGWLLKLDEAQRAPFRLCLRLSTPEDRDGDEGDGSDESAESDLEDDERAAPAGPPPLILLPPDADGQPAAPASAAPLIGAPGGGWRLDYFLQARDDPSLLLPLAGVWNERGDVARFLDRRFERPWEHALTWLGQAARAFPPIAASLAREHPDGCDLTGAEAYQFLAEAIPALEEVGVGVLAPSWWKRAPVKPALRLEVKRAQQTSSGLLGLDAVVSFDWKVALGGEELTAEELGQLAALKEPLVRLRGRWVEMRREDVEAALRTLAAHNARKMSLGEALRLSMTGQTDDGAVTIEEMRADEWIGDLLGRMRGGEMVASVPTPGGLHAELRPYQKRGLDWLAFLSRYGLGACLADDMGLGKTIQLLTLLLHLKETGAISGPALLVCPTSVAGNWLHEARRFAPGLRVLIHHGAGRIGRSDEAGFSAEATNNDLVITTYGLLPRDAKMLDTINWSLIALDEAQYIKNAETKQSHAARALSAPIRVALTGTPVENRLAELWSIMQFLNPGYLGSQKRFHERFAAPIEQRHDPNATTQLHALTRPFILRRLKTDPAIISDLPEKVEMREYCTLTREQATLYEAVVRDGLRQIEQADDPMARRGVILAMLTRLKQVCNHPAHFLNDGSALTGRSGKLARLEDLVTELLDDGDRALIFTQFTVMGQRLTDYLAKRFKLETLFLHGGVPRKQRERMVERFQSADGPPLFVLSLKAGGTGLNLTNANHVVHFDRWWNPAVETQATDRAFRIGQTRNVQVRKFVCSGTLEERIDEMIEQKRALAENIFGSGEGWLTELSTEELRDLFRLRAGAVAD